MNLPINNKELDTIVRALALGGDAALYHKLKGIREEYEPDGQFLSEVNPTLNNCDI